MGNLISDLNKDNITNSKKDIFKMKPEEDYKEVDNTVWNLQTSILPSKNDQRPIRECNTDQSSIQTIVHYLYNSHDEFNFNLYTSEKIDDVLLKLSILVTDQQHELLNLQPHPLFKDALDDLSMYISSKKDTPVITPIVFKLPPRVIKSESKISVDPLSDNLYDSNHKRLDRQEKHIRNVEREKFAHDRFYLEQKIDQLYGSNWKKVVMAISKITGSKDSLETQRHYIIQKLEQILKKFDSWKALELKHKKKSRKMLDLNKNYVSKSNNANFSEGCAKKQKFNLDTITSTPVVSKAINTQKNYSNKHIQKKRIKSSDSLNFTDNNIITPNFQTVSENANIEHKYEPVECENTLIKSEDIFIKHENTPVKTENMHIKNKILPIKREDDLIKKKITSLKNKITLVKNKNMPTKNKIISLKHKNAPLVNEDASNKNKSISIENKKVKIICSSTDDQKSLTFIKSPHIRHAIVNNWRRSNRMVLAFGQPLPKITTKIQEFSLPTEILKDVQKINVSY